MEVGNFPFEVGDVAVLFADFGELVFLLVFYFFHDSLKMLNFVFEVFLLLFDVLFVLGFVVFDFELVVFFFEDESFDEGPVDFVVGVECRDQLLDLLFIY